MRWAVCFNVCVCVFVRTQSHIKHRLKKASSAGRMFSVSTAHWIGWSWWWRPTTRKRTRPTSCRAPPSWTRSAMTSVTSRATGEQTCPDPDPLWPPRPCSYQLTHLSLVSLCVCVCAQTNTSSLDSSSFQSEHHTRLLHSTILIRTQFDKHFTSLSANNIPSGPQVFREDPDGWGSIFIGSSGSGSKCITSCPGSV